MIVVILIFLLKSQGDETLCHETEIDLSELWRWRPDSPEGGEDGVEDAEGEGHLYADPVEAGDAALVEAGQSLSPGDLPHTVPASPAEQPQYSRQVLMS